MTITRSELFFQAEIIDTPLFPAKKEGRHKPVDVTDNNQLTLTALELDRATLTNAGAEKHMILCQLYRTLN